MNKSKQPREAFFIGWKVQQDSSLVSFLKKIVFLILLIFMGTAALFVFSQDTFEDSKFELGQISELEGFLVMDPVPMIKIGDPSGSHSWSSVLLIGFGKFGAEKTLKSIESDLGVSIVNRHVLLRGTKIYHHGKLAFELTQGVDSFVRFTESPFDYFSMIKELGDQTLFGEILDPKCALGVMKPGYGKIHRSCAIRCISGGIPPVFCIQNNHGEKNYILLKGEDGEDINHAVLPYVADQMRLCGRLEQYDDWLIFYTDPSTDFVRLKPHWMKDDLVLCNQ